MRVIQRQAFSLAAIILLQISRCGAQNDSVNSNLAENPSTKERELFGNIVAIADSIANAKPTAPTTAEPTESPTESPKPSPSPSWAPSTSPTITRVPTVEPTIAPTESPKPSPSPSESPTAYPTGEPSVEPSLSPTATRSPTKTPSSSPTNFPSLSPSNSPSTTPTLSIEPSASPSSLPSSSPTSSPSVSMMPSMVPSVVPTESQSPTDVPSQIPSESPSSKPSVSMAPTQLYEATIQQTIVLTFEELHSEMQANVTKTFEKTTYEFLQNKMKKVQGGEIDVSAVRVLSQSLVMPNIAHNNKDNGKHRFLPSGLEVLLEIAGEYRSWVEPEQFDFEQHIFVAFEENWPLYKNLLLEKSVFFTPLVVQAAIQPDGADPSKEDRSLDLNGYVALCVVSVVAVSIGLVVSVYAIRRLRWDNLEKSLTNNTSSSYEEPGQCYSHSPTGIERSERPVPADSPKPIPEIQQQSTQSSRSSVVSSTKDSRKVDHPKSSLLQTIESLSCVGTMSFNDNDAMSPNTMEKAPKSSGNIGGLASNIMSHIVCSDSSSKQQDPPDSNDSRRYSQGEPAGQKPTATDPYYNNMKAGVMEEDRETTVSNALRGSNIFKISRDPSVVNAKFPYDDNYARSEGNMSGASRGYNEWGNDAPTSQGDGQGGRLGAADIHSSYHKKADGNTTPGGASSTYSSSFNAFLNMVGAPIGARPTDTASQQQHSQSSQRQNNNAQYNQANSNYNGGGGIYDVFAPSGALGIVVDTTKDGPAVHSLKQSSPMLGLITPGDLIIGLDNEDTRTMTAATLTRLMARKSHQHERKITLLSIENY